MTLGLMAQYAVIGVLLIGAVFSVWRRLAPSKAGGCASGCGTCSSGCQPTQRIALRTLDTSTIDEAERDGSRSITVPSDD
ncbi:FeoB-associated Cys-rich membrane protein [Pseudomonas fluorescens]|jgi:hypothetical protein|uniref:FeoB-associated Cys-rich membrane protein n=1 Tax=Pseudomonas fluorescens TaxID=294 RepID=UPI00093770A5|nr:FeoB-associated Cys-rich membrane protein [Pseudomonas fluorescens]UEL25735.1 FeoB-associated Cys-rich membrane protein [Pseudomonas fluorescens]